MRVGAVVIARLGSTRLPGKALMAFGAKPLLAHVLDRLDRASSIDGVVVATSDDPSDDAIAEWCNERGVDVFRGPLDDVLGRVIAAASGAGFDAVARVNGDSPWLDPGLLDRAVERFRKAEPDLVTNLLERDWPYGISAEIVSLDALRRVHEHAGAQEREHVTRAFYERPEAFAILNIPSESPVGAGLRLTVDSEADGRLFIKLLEALGPAAPRATTTEVIAAAQELETPGKDDL